MAGASILPVSRLLSAVTRADSKWRLTGKGLTSLAPFGSEEPSVRLKAQLRLLRVAPQGLSYKLQESLVCRLADNGILQILPDTVSMMD